MEINGVRYELEFHQLVKEPKQKQETKKEDVKNKITESIKDIMKKFKKR